MIQVQALTKRFDGVEALANLDLDVEAGSFNYLTGHSGAGKSTLIRLLLRLELPTRGRVLVDGEDLATMPRRRVPHYRRTIGSVFQDHHLLAGRTALENVAMPLEVLGLSTRDQRTRARAALGLVGLAGRESAYPGQLSLGEQQRVGIARAVVNRPKLLLADEPTGNLDPALSREVVVLFERFREIGATVIIATHDRDLLNVVPGREIRLVAGGLAVEESADDESVDQPSWDTTGEPRWRTLARDTTVPAAPAAGLEPGELGDALVPRDRFRSVGPDEMDGPTGSDPKR